MVANTIVNESMLYLLEIGAIANELNKFVRHFNMSIVDVTSDFRVAGASLLQYSIPCVYKYVYDKLNAYAVCPEQKNLTLFKEVERAMDTVLAYERTIGVLSIDSTTPEDVYFDLQPAIEIVQPYIMILGSSQFEADIQSKYPLSYAFRLKYKNIDKEIGRMYGVRKSGRRKSHC